MIRLINGEFKKLFLRPMTYIMAIILCCSLFISLLLFKPETKTYSSTSFTLSGNTLSEKQSSFNAYQSDRQYIINGLSDTLQSYEIQNRSLIVQNYKNSNDKTIQDLITAYTTIVNNGESYYGGATAFLNEASTSLLNLNNAFFELKDKYDALTKSTLPIVRISKSTHEIIASTLQDAIKQTTAPSIALTTNGHKAIKEMLATQDYNTKLTSAFAKIENINLTHEEVESIKKQYLIEGLTTKNVEIIEKVQNAATIDECINTAMKYNSNVQTAIKIVYLKIYEKVAENLPDGKIQDLYGCERLDINSDLPEGKATAYGIKEKLTAYNYIWNTNTYDFDYAWAANGNTTMSSSKSAIDYCINAMQLASFVIIIFCVVLGAMSISSEIDTGTIKLIAIKPISRQSIILAKVFATLFMGLIFLLFASIASFSIGYFAYGYNALPVLGVFNSASAFVISPLLYYLILILCVALKISMYVSLAIMLSTLFKNNIPSLIVALVIFFTGVLLSSALPTNNFVAFLPLVNADLFVYFGGSRVISTNIISSLFSPIYLNNASIWITTSYLIGFTIVFNMISMLVFKRRDI